MAREIVLSLIFLFILSMYQINQSLALTIFHSEPAPVLNDRLSLLKEYIHRLNQQQGSTSNIIQTDNKEIVPDRNWVEHDIRTSKKANKRMLCFFNTVTCFG
ncbi:unnamed protein product [Adineta steineri]|uniref:Uncharacterized protein n=1 Tax=Adineta steineri TaxID=433720 RepID=A0A818WSK7_9BILA|nr:unnamed protein product [Adineta steineri]CAF3727877.1 unnamed protein product [Adineta steineri]